MKHPAQINSWRQEADWWLSGLGRRDNVEKLLNGTGFYFGLTGVIWDSRQRWWLQNPVNVLNASELYTLKCLILCEVNCTSINENYKKKKINTQEISNFQGEKKKNSKMYYNLLTVIPGICRDQVKVHPTITEFT